MYVSRHKNILSDNNSKPAIAAMHGPHSLGRFGDQVYFGPIR